MRSFPWHSLAWKLTLGFVVVALIGALSMAFTIDWQTRRQFERFEENRYQNQLLADLGSYYQSNGSWDGVDQLFAESPSDEQEKPLLRFDIVLFDANDQVVFSKVGGEEGPVPRFEVPILIDDEAVGWLRLSMPPPPERDPAANDFLRLMSRAIGLSALFGSVVAFVVALLLARTLTRPIQALTAAARTMTKGTLGQQVRIHTHGELGDLGAAFNQMSRDLAHSVALRRQMTADIAHDLRTPLSVILGYTEALHDGKFQGSPAIYTILHEEALQLSRLIDDLRILSLADAGELPLHRSAVAPRELLMRAAKAYRVQAEKQAVALHVESTADLPRVDVDAERMGQVLNNLLTNALRHTPAGGEIRLGAHIDSSQPNGDQPHTPNVVLQVQDSGTGITPEDLPHIFERFYRGDKSRHSEGESGLGLAIAKSVVEMHDGTIGAASQIGQGTTFTITLPALVKDSTVST